METALVVPRRNDGYSGNPFVGFCSSGGGWRYGASCRCFSVEPGCGACFSGFTYFCICIVAEASGNEMAGWRESGFACHSGFHLPGFAHGFCETGCGTEICIGQTFGLNSFGQNLAVYPDQPVSDDSVGHSYVETFDSF